MKNFLKYVFAIVTCCVLLISIVMAIVSPKEINEYENRYMEQFKAFSIASYFDGSFQDQVELALADQLPLAITAKRSYNDAVSSVIAKLLKKYTSIAENDTVVEPVIKDENLAKDAMLGIYRGTRIDAVADPKGVYVTLPGGTIIHKGHILYDYRPVERGKDLFDRWLADANQLISDYPEIEFYSYYIEKETDLESKTGNRAGNFEYIHDNINLDEESARAFMVNSFFDIDKYFYKTDHHWNAYGSYLGYKQVLSMILPNETPLEPNGYYEIANMKGSHTMTKYTQAFSEMMGIYDFDFADVEIYIAGEQKENYGSQIKYINEYKQSGQLLNMITTYGDVYGGDDGEIILHNKGNQNGNILIIGDSYDNAILMLLSNHFEDIYSIDLRNYKAQLGKDFNIDEYIKEHNIERVLLIGSIGFFSEDTEVLGQYRQNGI